MSEEKPPTVVVTPKATTLIGAGTEVMGGVVTGLAAQPVLLLIVLLNLTMILAASYFLTRQEAQRSETVRDVLKLVQACIMPGGPVK